MKEGTLSFSKIDTRYIRLTKVDWSLIKEVSTGLYVEVGSFHGASASAALRGGADRVISIDIYDWQPKVCKSDKILFFQGTSVDYIERRSPTQWIIDTLFIDGSHEFEYVLKDCESLIPYVKSGGFILFHDHNPNNPMTGVFRAVNKYLDKGKYKVFPKVEGSGNMLKVQKI